MLQINVYFILNNPNLTTKILQNMFEFPILYRIHIIVRHKFTIVIFQYYVTTIFIKMPQNS